MHNPYSEWRFFAYASSTCLRRPDSPPEQPPAYFGTVSEALVFVRNFTPTAPNQVWTSDITYLWTDKGRFYLAIVLDLFNREIVGWSLKPHMTTDIVTDTLTMAWFRKRPAPGLMHHSDRGSQYASHAFQNKLQGFGMTCSMNKKGNRWDNAPTESWFNSFKNERVQINQYSASANRRKTDQNWRPKNRPAPDSDSGLFRQTTLAITSVPGQPLAS